MLQSESAAQAPADPEGPGARRAFWPETAFWALGEQFPPVALLLKIAKRVPICWHARHLRALRAVGRVGCKGLGDGGVGAHWWPWGHCWVVLAHHQLSNIIQTTSTAE